MCMILLPNCCSVIILNIHQCHVVTKLVVCSERTRLLRKANGSAHLDLKLEKKNKSVWPALFRGNVCI